MLPFRLLKRSNPKKSSQSPGSKAKKITPHPAIPIGAGRKWLFRGVAVLVVPFTLLLILELGLRLAGYGHPTHFFLAKKIKGREVLVENETFGFQFFPAGMARSPAPVVMPREKG